MWPWVNGRSHPFAVRYKPQFEVIVGLHPNGGVLQTDDPPFAPFFELFVFKEKLHSIAHGVGFH